MRIGSVFGAVSANYERDILLFIEIATVSKGRENDALTNNNNQCHFDRLDFRSWYDTKWSCIADARLNKAIILKKKVMSILAKSSCW